MKSISIATAVALTAAHFAGAANLALTGTAFQSTTGFGGVASRAVDGNRNGVYGGNSVTHTNNGANDFWQVDFGATRHLSTINLWNRTDCCANRLDNFSIQVFDAASSLVFEQVIPLGGSGQFNPAQSFAFPIGTEGRIVRIQRDGPNSGGNNYISLAEVEVFGSQFGPNAARLGIAALSSTGSGGTADRGNDGIANPDFFDQGSVFHSGSESNPWWEVQLPVSQAIWEVTAVNRADGGLNTRLGDVQVDVYSGANLVFSELVATGGALYFDVLTNGVVGDRVRLTANNPGSGLFHLAEVMVFVPEPSRAILLAFGLVAAALRRRR